MNTRMLPIVLVAALLFGGCSDPEMEKRVVELETKITDLEKKVASGPTKATPANEAEEQAAAELLKAATKLAEEMKYDDAKGKVKELREKHPTTRAARAAQRLESELAIIGKEAGSMNVEKWYQGNVASLDEGKATLLVFWEVWCPHCKREVPKLGETSAKYNGKGLNVVGLTKLTRNVTEDQVTAFIKDNGVTYPMAKEKGDAMSQHFGVRGIPAAAMVKDGKVVWRGHPARLTDQMLESWISG